MNPFTTRRRAKLIPDQVRAIRASTGYSHRQLAAAFNISRSQISFIRRGLAWKEVRS